MQIHKKDWATGLLEVVWAYMITWKTTSFTTYELVYGKKAILLIEFEYKTLRKTLKLGMDLCEAQKDRLHNLNALDEIKMESIHHTNIVQKQKMRWHD